MTANSSALRVFLTVLVFTCLGDFLFWPAVPGLSVALFIMVICAAVFVNRPFSLWTHGGPARAIHNGLLLLLLATVVQSAVEVSFTNITVAFILSLGILGETSFPGLKAGWERWSAAFWALLKAPGRWGWVASLDWANSGVLGVVTRGIAIGFPALLLVSIFAGLLGSGNAILGTWISSATQDLFRWIACIDLSVGRFVLDAVLASLALVLLCPSEPNPMARIRFPKLARMQPGSNPSIAWWRSAVVLGSLNALFFAVNTIDAIYLWIRAGIPAGVSPSAFLHQGVNSLICAVVLSALLLTVIFQQALEISSSIGLKRLAYAWIAQNLVLIASVMLRLARYVEAYQLTTQRVYVGCFLVLVTAGFGLLTTCIARSHSASWLLFGNAVATFALFFVLQFLDVAGWVAHFNVAHSEHPDIGYLEQLGPSAWVALSQVATSTTQEGREAQRWLSELKENERASQTNRNWRSWQWRRAARVSELLASPRE